MAMTASSTPIRSRGCTDVAITCLGACWGGEVYAPSYGESEELHSSPTDVRVDASRGPPRRRPEAPNPTVLPHLRDGRHEHGWSRATPSPSGGSSLRSDKQRDAVRSLLNDSTRRTSLTGRLSALYRSCHGGDQRLF